MQKEMPIKLSAFHEIYKPAKMVNRFCFMLKIYAYASSTFLFLTIIIKMIKPTIRMAGKIDMILKVAWAPTSSIDLPIIGRTIEVATNPAPPKIDIPNAPLFGTYSEATPIIVGQK